MNAFFRMSGLSGWTEAHRAAYTFHLSTRLARQAMGGIDALDPDLAAVLKKNGLYDRFELLGKMIDEVEGEHYVIPENAYRLTDDDLAAYLPDSLREKPDALTPEQWEAARADGFNSIRQKLAQDVMGYFADETSYAVLEPDAKTRAAMYGNTRPGTKAGEMLRFPQDEPPSKEKPPPSTSARRRRGPAKAAHRAKTSRVLPTQSRASSAHAPSSPVTV